MRTSQPSMKARRRKRLAEAAPDAFVNASVATLVRIATGRERQARQHPAASIRAASAPNACKSDWRSGSTPTARLDSASAPHFFGRTSHEYRRRSIDSVELPGETGWHRRQRAPLAPAALEPGPRSALEVIFGSSDSSRCRDTILSAEFHGGKTPYRLATLTQSATKLPNIIGRHSLEMSMSVYS